MLVFKGCDQRHFVASNYHLERGLRYSFGVSMTEESTKMVVLNADNGILSFSTSSTQSSGFTERSVKYIANRPAKNINSLASQTIVPIDTIFGRWAAVGIRIAEEVLTVASLAKA